MPETKEPEDKLLLSLLAWGTATFFVIGGWFAQPRTTHYIFHQETKDGEIIVHDIDLISLKSDSSESTRVRGRGLLIFGLFGVTTWLAAVCYLNYSLPPNAIRRLPAWAIYTFAGIISVFFIGFILKMVDLIID